MFWKEDVIFEVTQYSKHHIHGKFLGNESGDQFWLIGVYGHLKVPRRPKIWSLLRSLKTQEVDSWFMFGDFYEVMEVSENWGEELVLRDRWRLS